MAHTNVLIYGGDGRISRTGVLPERAEVIPSTRHGGNGSVRRAVARIRGGACEGVILLTRWLGHSAFHALKAACRKAGIPCIPVYGGQGAVTRALEALTEGVTRG